MSHNQILFNSPALHSLKRGQLVKLCKMHSLKANGKNTQLIERLKKRAADLPPGAVNFQWKDSSDEEGDGDEDEEEGETENELLTPNPFREVIERPSEQWEIIMEDIQEEKSAVNTLASVNSTRTGTAGEFGTGGTKSESRLYHSNLYIVCRCVKGRRDVRQCSFDVHSLTCFQRLSQIILQSCHCQFSWDQARQSK